jgi:hypothetical protein
MSGNQRTRQAVAAIQKGAYGARSELACHHLQDNIHARQVKVTS